MSSASLGRGGPMFKVGDIVRVKAHPSIWGEIKEILDNNIHYLVVSKHYKPRFLAEAHEIEYAPLEALADVGDR